MRIGLRIAALAAVVPWMAAFAQDSAPPAKPGGVTEGSDALLQQLQTKDLQLVWFHPTEDYLAPHVARSFENSIAFQKSVWGWQPDGKVTVLLKDFIDYGNAGATSIPGNLILIDIAPVPYTLETFVANERMFWFMNHELVHVANLDEWTAADMRWRHLLGGKVAPDAAHPETLLYRFLTDPRTVVPRWYLEGVAVFFETWMGGGRGRAQGAYDEMVFRAMVRDTAHFYDPAGLASEGTQVDFQVGVNNYLYGTRFISYLALKYSPEKIVEWVARHEGSKRYYADQFEQVFGKPMEAAWQDWIAWEHGFQKANLAEVAKYPLSAFEPLSRRGLGSTSRAFYDKDRDAIIAGFRYPGVAAYIGVMSLKDGSIRPLVDVKGPMLYRVTSLAWDPDTKTAFYTTDNISGYRDVLALDTATGATRMLQEDARIGDLVFDRSDRSLWGIRHLNGIVTLVRMPYPYSEFHQVHSWPYGEIVYDLDISPDGKTMSFSHTAVNGDQALYMVPIEQLLADDATPTARFDFGSAVPEGFVFSPDGRSLYGSSYYTGVSNIYRYDLASGKIDALSNTQTGLFRPLPLPDGRMLAFEFTGQGLLPGFLPDTRPREDLAAITFLGAQIAEQHAIVKRWNVGSPGKIDLDKLTVSQGPYQSFREIREQALYPMVQGYKDSWALGMHGSFGDPVGLDRIGVDLAWSPDGSLPKYERAHFAAQWQHLGWRIGYKHNGADFYDLFGPTKVSLRGNEWLVGYKRPLIYDTPRTLDLDLSLKTYNGLDTLPGSQNVDTPISKLTRASAKLDYGYVLDSLGHVDDEKGLRWNLNLDVNRVYGSTIPMLYGGVDFGWPFLFDHSSLWLRNYAGWSHGKADDPFANFYFGAFGNNYVDHGEVKRYREYDSFPGFEIDQLNGRTYARSMLEWNLPPIRFASIGTPANYLSWARPALFAGVLRTNPNDSALAQTLEDVGFQIDFRFNVMHDQEMTLSLGAAHGFGDGTTRGRNEWMLSLKVLH
jgi:WD40-like Beta Propeller Repeat